MNEASSIDDAAPEVAAPVQVSGPEQAGRMLREQREKTGLHIAAMSVALKVPVAKIEALEQGRINDLPGIAFTRSLASTICRHLKMDPAPVLALLPLHAPRALENVGEGINTPFHKPGDLVSAAEAWRRVRPTAYAVLAILLAALLVYAFPANWLKLPVKSVARTDVQGTTTEVVTAVLPQPTASAAEVETPAPALVTSQAVSPQTATASAAESPLDATANVVLSFHAEADTWVEVLDREKQLVLKKLIKAGETQLAQGKPPLSVSIGNAAKTSMQVRGKPFDLAPVTRENVARFTVQ